MGSASHRPKGRDTKVELDKQYKPIGIQAVSAAASVKSAEAVSATARG